MSTDPKRGRAAQLRHAHRRKSQGIEPNERQDDNAVLVPNMARNQLQNWFTAWCFVVYVPMARGLLEQSYGDPNTEKSIRTTIVKNNENL
jgi:hypothetical protein